MKKTGKENGKDAQLQGGAASRRRGSIGTRSLSLSFSLYVGGGRVGGRGQGAHLEAVHLGEDLVERLLALVVAAGDARPALAAHRVDLVDEDDARRRLLRLRARPRRQPGAPRGRGGRRDEGE